MQSDPIGLAGGLNGYLYAFADPLTRADRLGLRAGNPFPRTLLEQLIDFLMGKPAEKLGSASALGRALGKKICDAGTVPRGPLIDCADCIRVYPEYDAQEACFESCRETIEKCTRKPKQQAECRVPN